MRAKQKTDQEYNGLENKLDETGPARSIDVC